MRKVEVMTKVGISGRRKAGNAKSLNLDKMFDVADGCVLKLLGKSWKRDKDAEVKKSLQTTLLPAAAESTQPSEVVHLQPRECHPLPRKGEGGWRWRVSSCIRTLCNKRMSRVSCALRSTPRRCVSTCEQRRACGVLLSDWFQSLAIKAFNVEIAKAADKSSNEKMTEIRSTAALPAAAS
eukprot:683050-Hanusia_phi.AAC.1